MEVVKWSETSVVGLLIPSVGKSPVERKKFRAEGNGSSFLLP